MNEEMGINSDTPNIIIIDDVPANLKVLGAILKADGYKVRPVTNGVLALQVAEKEKPDLVLLDIMMPDMNGFEVCRQFKQNPNLREVPVIFISALSDTNDIVKALSAGGADYITKPFQAEEVRARVDTHLKLYQQNKKLQEQSKYLNDLSATKNKLFSIISHDLRSPFTVILGYSEMITDKIEKLDKTTIKKYVSDINIVASATLKLLDNLLEWSRVQMGLLTPKIRKVNLKNIVFEITDLNEGMAKTKNISIKNNILSDIIVNCDEEMTKTILRNLISNALKFTKKTGTISIDAKTNDSFVEIMVSDNGVGIPSEKISCLYSLNMNTSTMGTENEKGSGLGLMLCKELIEMQGGKIWAESVVGKGSTFSISIPNISI